MKVVIIGAGNVASVFGRLAKKSGHEILQVYSRKITSAELLAGELQCSCTDNFSDIFHSADIYIVAITDVALSLLKENINLGNRIVVHTAGSVQMDVLKEVSENYGVLYPFQSLRKEIMVTSMPIPLLVDGNNEKTLHVIEEFAKTLSDTVSRMNDDERMKLHIAAVVINNFTNHLYALAADYCKAEKLDFKMLLPMIEETALRLRYTQPGDVQTGPAVRKDIITLDKHLRILTAHPKLRTVYLRMTDSIMNP